MPRSLAPIPIDAPIADRIGAITLFFRLRWQELVDGFGVVPTRGLLSIADRNTALPATILYTTIAAAVYRVGYYIRKTAADGVASSLTVTIAWTEGGAPKTYVFGALAVDAIDAKQSDFIEVPADAASDLTIAIAYVSTTPGNMHYIGVATCEQLT